MLYKKELITRIYCIKTENTGGFTCFFDTLHSIGKSYRGIKKVIFEGNNNVSATLYPDYEAIEVKPIKEGEYIICTRETQETPNDIFHCKHVMTMGEWFDEGS
ncbi:hypothetical protein LCGC14_0223320 [marine sediment metagenome]|uniref:Uncharacterized protein n=1 Tax=marine sediment metagenome TaxID=412755 RepID=A0A0F9UGD8_9ZZZZ|nr:hypothetical protein [bacterium]